MRISKLRIENYRNLDGVSISFDEDVSYIVGENNLGKTNVLDLLNTIFNQATISEEDFAHMTQSAVKSHNGPADRLQSVGGACR